MQRPLSTTERYTYWLLRHPILAILFSILLFVGIMAGGKNIYFDTNYRVFFSSSNPQLEAFDQIERTYTQTDNIMFVVRPKNSDVFSREVLTLIQELTEESWRLPYATRVDSLTNFQHTHADEDNLFVEDLVTKDADQLTDEELSAIRDVALTEPLLVKKTISSDGKTTGINVTVTMPREDASEVVQATAAVRALVAQ